jgi:hypothetical protein
MQRPARLRVLLLADDHRSHASTLLEHIDALKTLSRHDVRAFNPRNQRGSLALDLHEFDVVVIHYSIMVLSDHYLAPSFRARIADFRGLTIQFIQDDYRQVAAMWHRMRELRIDVLFTLVPEREVEKVWPSSELPGVRKVTTLAGYVPSAAAGFEVRRLDQRPLDVSYRGRALPAWLGVLGQEKAWIAQGFTARAEAAGLRCDVDWRENARIYGDDWFAFIASSRVTLGTESGASITDFDGTLETRAAAWLAEHPGAGFWDVHEAVLAPYENNIRMNVISPRIFEAIALRTGLVLFPGEYSGLLEPDRHYIVLEKDFSNFDEVAAQIRDTPALERRIERAYDEIVARGRFAYDVLAEHLDNEIEASGARAGDRRPLVRFHAAVAEQRIRGYSLARPGSAMRRALRIAAVVKFVASDSDARGVLTRYAVDPRSLRATRPRRLIADLARMSLLRRAQSGRITAGESFFIHVLDSDAVGGLRLASSRDPETPHPPRDVAFPIVWNHAELGSRFAVPLTRRHWAYLTVGSDDGSLHEFTALEQLHNTLPGPVTKLVAPVTAASRRSSTSTASPAAPLHIARHCVHYGRKFAHIVATLARRRAERDLLLTIARRNRPLAGRLLKDLMKLEVARLAAMGAVADTGGLAAHIEGGTLSLVSTLAEQPVREPMDAGSVRAVRWDHSAVAVVAFARTQLGTIPYGLLPDGVYRFTAISEAAALAPTAVSEVLSGFVLALQDRLTREREVHPQPVAATTIARRRGR